LTTITFSSCALGRNPLGFIFGHPASAPPDDSLGKTVAAPLIAHQLRKKDCEMNQKDGDGRIAQIRMQRLV